MKLVIIEGPGKRETLKKYLGSGYEVFASKGHVRDLPAKELSIDINHNFEPKYEILPDKIKLQADVLDKNDVALKRRIEDSKKIKRRPAMLDPQKTKA